MMGAAGVAAILGAGPLIAIGAISEPDNGGAIAAGVITGLLGVALTGLGVQEYTAGGRMIARSVDEEASTPAAPPPESDAVPGRPVPDD